MASRLELIMEFDEHLLRHKMEFTLSQQVFVWIERHLALRLHLAFVSEAGCGCMGVKD